MTPCKPIALEPKSGLLPSLCNLAVVGRVEGRTKRSKSSLSIGLKYSSLERATNTLKVSDTAIEARGVFLRRRSGFVSSDTANTGARLDSSSMASTGGVVLLGSATYRKDYRLGRTGLSGNSIIESSGVGIFRVGRNSLYESQSVF